MLSFISAILLSSSIADHKPIDTMKKERMIKGKVIYEKNQLMEINKSTFIVASQSNPGQSYKILMSYNNSYDTSDPKTLKYFYNFTCTCPDYQFRNKMLKYCKHIYAVLYYIGDKLDQYKNGLNNSSSSLSS